METIKIARLAEIEFNQSIRFLHVSFSTCMSDAVSTSSDSVALHLGDGLLKLW